MSKRRKRIRPADEARTYILSSCDKPEFVERYIDRNKGRGVFANQPVEPGAFVLEYKGELVAAEEFQARHYTELQSTFLFDFEWQQRHWCIDASKEDGSLGRLCNDNHKSPNCSMKKIIVNNRPHLCLFAMKRIEIGSEIEYNYGDAQWPWRNKGPKKQSSALQTDSSPTDHPSNDDPKMDDEITQGPKKQSSALQTDSSPTDHPSDDDPKMDDEITQVFTGGFGLVNYSESDETDEDKDNPTSPPSGVVQQKTRNGNIQMDAVPDYSEPLFDSSESIVDETDEDSSSQSDSEVVSKLRMTKSILMDKVPDFSVPSDDSTDEIATPKMEMALERPKRSFLRPIQRHLVESDDSCGDSEDEYIPDPREESTGDSSDCSLELSLKNKQKSAITQSRSKSSQSQFQSSSQSRSESSSQSRCESSGQRRFETSQDSVQDCRFSNSRDERSREKTTARTYSNKEMSISVPLEEEPSVYVNPVLKKEDGSRRYNKKHHCLYCGQVVQKMSRHLSRRHSDVVEVAKALSLPKNSKERRLQLDYIRNKGNFEHNVEVLESRQGKLIPWKQPKKKTEGQEFMHCVYCFGLFRKRVMWRHFQVCNFKPQGKSSKRGKTRVQALCAFAEPAPTGLSDTYWKFLNEMNQDEVAVAIKEDRCILEYGFRLFNKNENVISQHQYIRQKLRELARLVLEAKKMTHVKSIKELIKPEKYSHVVRAARCLAGFSDKTGKYQRPSLARKVGHGLHALAMFIKSEGLKTKDQQTAKDAEEFALLYQESWKFDIASQALTQLNQTKWNSPQILPFTQDVQKLHSHLSEKQQTQLDALRENPSPLNWKDLAKVTLAQVILFNRRRAGEVSRMPLSVYLSKDTSETHQDVNLALTALEQKLCKHFVRIAIVGKRGRKVPVLLTPVMRESLDALTEKREECGVLKENCYLFALPHSVHYLRGSDCIRQFVNECDDIKHPKALTSTKLRKHIATLSTVLNLKTTELDQLADFLGHNIEVHRKHYRLPEGTLQLAKISKVLLALEKGRLGEFKGKNLDEIQLDVTETVDLDMDGCSQEEDEFIPEAEDSVTSIQEPTSTVYLQPQTKSAKKRGKQTAVKRSWTSDECAAVERHLRKFIVRNQVPGKMDCQHCVDAEAEVLVNRDWKAVKYFIKNRISSIRKKVH
ncbi:uncharacterized protein [Garra rufa]|uniref:uncharacterized protein n=1 Tax=Garra rufa TaxID=137080 RepID=UPI003CCEA785